jgi:hypothetical protein
MEQLAESQLLGVLGHALPPRGARDLVALVLTLEKPAGDLDGFLVVAVTEDFVADVLPFGQFPVESGQVAATRAQTL